MDAGLSVPPGTGRREGVLEAGRARGAGRRAGWAGPGDGGATLRRLCPRLPAEPRRREAAPFAARRPRLRHRPRSPTFPARRPRPAPPPPPEGGPRARLRPRYPSRQLGGRGDSGVPAPRRPSPASLSRKPPAPPLRPAPHHIVTPRREVRSPLRQDVPPGKAPGEWGPGLRGWGSRAPGNSSLVCPPDPASVRPALQVLDLGDLRPHQGGIPVPPGAVPQVRGGGAPRGPEFTRRAHLGAGGKGRGQAWLGAKRRGGGGGPSVLGIWAWDGAVSGSGEGCVKPITLKPAQRGCAWVSLGGGRESGGPHALSPPQPQAGM